MSVSFEGVLTSDQYLQAGNIKLSKPPIINTSLNELAEYGYRLFVNANFCPTLQSSKIHMTFRGHDGFAGLTLTFWEPIRIRTAEDVIYFLANGDMQPNHLHKKDSRFYLQDPNQKHLRFYLLDPKDVESADVKVKLYNASAGYKPTLVETVKQEDGSYELVLDNYHLETDMLYPNQDSIPSSTDAEIDVISMLEPEDEFKVTKHFNDLRSQTLIVVPTEESPAGVPEVANDNTEVSIMDQLDAFFSSFKINEAV